MIAKAGKKTSAAKARPTCGHRVTPRTLIKRRQSQARRRKVGVTMVTVSIPMPVFEKLMRIGSITGLRSDQVIEMMCTTMLTGMETGRRMTQTFGRTVPPAVDAIFEESETGRKKAKSTRMTVSLT